MERFNQIGDVVYELPRTNIFNLDDIRARVEKSKSRIDMYKSKYGDGWQKEYIIGEGFVYDFDGDPLMRMVNNYILHGYHSQEFDWSQLSSGAVRQYLSVLNERLYNLFGSDFEFIWFCRPRFGYVSVDDIFHNKPDSRSIFYDDVACKMFENADLTGEWQTLPFSIRHKYCGQRGLLDGVKSYSVAFDNDISFDGRELKQICRTTNGIKFNFLYKDIRACDILDAAKSLYSNKNNLIDYNYLWFLRFEELLHGVVLSDDDFYDRLAKHMFDFYVDNKDVCKYTDLGYNKIVDEKFMWVDSDKSKLLQGRLSTWFLKKFNRLNFKRGVECDDVPDIMPLGEPNVKYGIDANIPTRTDEQLCDEFRVYDDLYGIYWRCDSISGSSKIDTRVNEDLLSPNRYFRIHHHFGDFPKTSSIVRYAHMIQKYRFKQFYGFDVYELDKYGLDDRRIIDLLLLDAVNTGNWFALPSDLYYLYHCLIGVFDGTESFGYCI